jgi:hypothetical protein
MTKNKEVSIEQFDEFWRLFNERYPDIDAKLPSSRILVNGSIMCNQPAKMLDDEYNVYFRFLQKWYMDNGFIEKKPVTIIAITAGHKLVQIISDSLVEIEPIDDFSTRVKYRETIDIVSEVVININSEVLKHRFNV